VRVAFFCMESVFSYRPMAALLDAGVDVRLAVRPVGGLLGRKEPTLRREGTSSLRILKKKLRRDDDTTPVYDPFVLAEEAGIPRWSVGNASTPAVKDLLRRERIDLIVVAFFNQLLKPLIFETPELGAINTHPSLLPSLRGPSPLFWTFQQGLTETGLSVHRVAAGEDDGDLLAQHAVSLAEPRRGEDVVDELSALAADTLVQVVQAAGSGPTSTPQQGAPSRAPRPTLDDLKLEASMGAERIFRFVRGVGRWTPPAIETGERPIRVIDAIDILPDQKVPGDFAVVGDHVLFGTETGTVVLQRMGA